MLLARPRPSNLLPTQPPDEPEAGPSRLAYSSHPTPILAPIPTRPPAPPSPSDHPTPPRRPPSRTERRFACTHPGCDKAYFKPSRLAEHELTHTGQRPHACPHCSQTYLRASHLAAHLRTHKDESEKGFVCGREGCGKTFWTRTHLKRHEVGHDAPRVYQCEKCDEAFHKAHQLREHVARAHMPPGSKPYLCGHDGCDASFAMRQHLKAHERTHDATRYTCSHPEHGPSLPSFPNWSALQSHLHTAHPPVCPHAECAGRTFKNHQRLRDHLRVHADRDADLSQGPLQVSEHEHEGEEMDDGGLSRREKKRRRSEVEPGGRSPKLPRVLGGEAGKVFSCGVEECQKKFKSRFALKTHHRATHLSLRPHTCPHEACDRSYAHLSNLQRHLVWHARPSEPSTPPLVKLESGIEALTGEKPPEKRRWGCPVHFLSSAEEGQDVEQEEEEEECGSRFWRVYDVKRHLKGDHGVELSDVEIRELLGRMRGNQKA